MLELVKKLIEIPSTTDNKKALKEVLEVVKKELSGFSVKEYESNGFPSLLFYNSDEFPNRFKFLLNAHLDVVSAKSQQYAPFEKNGKLYGRGANDMKAAATVMILLFKELAPIVPYSLGLQLVTDEEVGGFNGTKYQIDKGVKADFVIAGEPTDMEINNKAKGIVRAKVTTQGKTAHGAYPWNGENAIWNMNKFLNKLEHAFPVPQKESWVTTVNLARIETSNQEINKVPADCTASLDIRYVPEDSDTIEDTLKELAGDKVKVNILLKEPAQYTSENNEYILALQKETEKITGTLSQTIVKHGGSDVRFFNAVGIDGITFGPVGAGLHSDEEWVNVKSLETYCSVIKKFLTKQ